MTLDDTVAVATSTKQSFQLKGSLFTLTVMQLFSVNVEILGQQLSATIKRSPTFFQNAPIILDLHALIMTDAVIDFAELTGMLREHKLIPVGIRGGTKQQVDGAVAAGLAVFPSSKVEQEEKPAVASKKPPQSRPVVNGTKVITSPIRSGQQVYAQGGDLIVLSSVSHGAELLADGHIHVYGTLRGRALAGVTGDENAYIFCHQLKADLVSIAGHYQVRDNYRLDNKEGAYTRISFSNGHLCIDTIDK